MPSNLLQRVIYVNINTLVAFTMCQTLFQVLYYVISLSVVLKLPRSGYGEYLHFTDG